MKASLMKFLIVDDDKRIRQLIKTVVSDDAAIFCECGDGAQARASYAAHRPDWVLMDLTMPEMDGITATRQIRSDDPSARVVIVTAHDSAALREEARVAGACGYVLKENLLDLLEILRAPAAAPTEPTEAAALPTI
jgi:two-component system chemotaxis response regulator CheY